MAMQYQSKDQRSISKFPSIPLYIFTLPNSFHIHFNLVSIIIFHNVSIRALDNATKDALKNFDNFMKDIVSTIFTECPQILSEISSIA